MCGSVLAAQPFATLRLFAGLFAIAAPARFAATELMRLVGAAPVRLAAVAPLVRFAAAAPVRFADAAVARFAGVVAVVRRDAATPPAAAVFFAFFAAALVRFGVARFAATFFAVVVFAAVVFAAVRLIASALSFWQLGTQSAAELTVLEALPRHAQMVTFRAVECPPPMPWTIDRSTHLSGYAIARRHAYSNDQWDVPGAQLLKIHNPAVGPFATDGSVLVFETRCGAEPSVIAKAEKVPSAVPYLWVIWEHDPQPIPGWEPVNRNGGSILYRRRPDRSAASSGKSP